MAAGLLAAAAAAQTVPNALPGAAEPGRKVPAAPTPPPLKLRWTLELPAGPAPPEVLADETLTLNEVRLDGVTVYHRADLRDLFEPYLGKEITLRAFYGIAAAIQARYQADGYLLSFAYVPPQSVDDGVFTIAVVEGYVDKVVVEDLEGALKRTLERTLAAITRARPLRAEVLERQMLLANDLAGVTASGVLQPSRDAVGAAQLIVKTSLDRVAGSVVIDNRGSPYTGPWEATGRVDLNTPFGLGERLSASATVTRRPRELRSFGLGYAQPLGAYGLRLDLDLGYALSAPGFTLRRFEVETTSLSADLRLSYPIIRSRDQTLSLGGGLSFLDSEVDLLDSRFSRDRLRSARLGLTYNRRGLIGGNSSSSLALRLTQGLPVLNATDPDRDATSRADTEPTYAKATLDLVHFQPLIDRLGLLLSLSGQVAPRPLPAAEEFALGGARYGRAYDPAEITGEQGVALSLELGYDLLLDETFVRRVSPFLFYDIGKAWDQASSASCQ